MSNIKSLKAKQARLDEITNLIGELKAEVIALTGFEGDAPAKVAKPAKKASPVKPGAFKRISRDEFKALKANGTVPYGMTQQQAHDLGLLDGTGTKVSADAVLNTTKRTTKAKPARKVAKKAVKRTNTPWGRSLTAHARTSGLWVKDGNEWTSVYTRLVGTDWGLATALHETNSDTKDAFEAYVTYLREEGLKVKHYSTSKGARAARDAKAAPYADRKRA